MLSCDPKARKKKLTLEDELTCGRPLGLRWFKGKLYVLDAYHGLFELDMAKDARATHLVSVLSLRKAFVFNASSEERLQAVPGPMVLKSCDCATVWERTAPGLPI